MIAQTLSRLCFSSHQVTLEPIVFEDLGFSEMNLKLNYFHCIIRKSNFVFLSLTDMCQRSQ